MAHHPLLLLRTLLLSVALPAISLAAPREANIGASLQDTIVSDDARIFSPAEIAELEAIATKAEERGALIVRVRTETSILRELPINRAREIDSEFRSAWEANPQNTKRGLAEEIDFSAEGGGSLPTEVSPLPVIFYFVRGARDDSDVLVMSGIPTLSSELSTPQTQRIVDQMKQHFDALKEENDSPSKPVVEAIRYFTGAISEQRAVVFSPESRPNTATIVIPALSVIIGGALAAILLVIVLKQFSGKDTAKEVTAQLPTYPLKTRLGGRHSGGMAATASWSGSPANPPKSQDSQSSTTLPD